MKRESYGGVDAPWARVLTVAAILMAVGLSVFFYKVNSLGFPLTPSAERHNWLVEFRYTFSGTDGPAIVRGAIPADSPGYAVLDHKLKPDTGLFGFNVEDPEEKGDATYAVLTRRELEGRAVVFVRTRLIEKDASTRKRTQKEPPEAVSSYRKSSREEQIARDPTPFLVALDNVVKRAHGASVGRPGFAFEAQKLSAAPDNEDIQTIIEGGPIGLDESARRLAFILNAGGYPARRVTGLNLKADAQTAQLTQWVDFWRRDTNEWMALDPDTGVVIEDQSLLPLVFGEAELVNGQGVRDLEQRISVKRYTDNRPNEALWSDNPGMKNLISSISLLDLPIDEQLVFRVLLLVPIGALLIAFFRQVIGLQTFGTFMPVLIALSFRESGLLTGVGLFILIVGTGLALRAYFDRLKLLVVPRLSAVLIIVTMVMIALALIGNAVGFQTGLSISLFPIVILTMTIERMSLVWDEYGAREALQRGTGSLAAAVIAYLVMSNEWIEHMAFTFPELMLVLLALTILLGRYNGFKLTEYARFKMFGQDEGLGL